MSLEAPSAVLIDATNAGVLVPHIVSLVSQAPVVGFDIETYDEPHDGIASYRNAKRLVFDVKRTTVAGFSIYAEGDENAYYINLAHADADKRVPWHQAKAILDAIPDSTLIICHNAPFELTMMGESLGYEFGDNIVCSLQMAVSAYGPDEYPEDKWVSGQLGGIKKLNRDIAREFATWQQGDGMSPEQHELLVKVIAKESDADHSYNGFVKSISYGYGLKQAVKSWFGYQMTTFEDCLNGKEHMGLLTGPEVVAYGADDAFWCVKLFYRLLEFMRTHCPNAIQTFMTQENPMIHVYSRLWREGLRVNHPAIQSQEAVERSAYAKALRELKTACKKLLPFSETPHEGLLKYDSRWYNPAKVQGLRDRLEAWITSPDYDDDFTQCKQVSSAVTNDWLGIKSTQNSNISVQHYYQARLIMYDLMQMRNYVYKGKTQSDGDSRGNMLQRIDKYRGWINAGETGDNMSRPDDGRDLSEWLDACEDAIKAMNDLAGIDQRMKLYITPYLQLTDPDTDRMYPVLSSKLATRRMAMSYPNGMQLAKRGQSTYVRGFYVPDEEDEVLVALDWSQIELVLIGEFSGDPEFAKAYGQLPYQDLHLGAAADVLSVVWPDVTEEMLKNCDVWDDQDIVRGLLYNANGMPIDRGKRKKYWRTEVGKGSNFNYVYSGALSTVGERLRWSPDQMWAATEKYRQRFAGMEAWRLKTIEDAKMTGFVELPDGHRRYRFENTHRFSTLMTNLIERYQNRGLTNFYNEVIRKIRVRAGNQLVNAMIQGSCATLAKRSILSINQQIATDGWRARFKMPIHDELVFSVHREEVPDFITMAKEKMCHHPEIISNLAVDSTASIGLTFEPWQADKAPIGQIEVDEAPNILGFTPDSKLTNEEIRAAVNYLYETANG